MFYVIIKKLCVEKNKKVEIDMNEIELE